MDREKVRSTLSESRWVGAIVMPLLLLGALCAVSIPLIAAIILGSCMPTVGELRPGNGWRLLHLLWMYPVMYLVEVVAGGFNRHFTGVSEPRGVAGVVVGAIIWLALSAMFGVFFVHPAGAALTAAAALALSRPFLRMIERATEKRESEGTST